MPKKQRWLLVYLYGAGGSTKSYNLKRPPYEEIRRALVANGAYILVPELGPSHFMNDAAKKTLSNLPEGVRRPACEGQLPNGVLDVLADLFAQDTEALVEYRDRAPFAARAHPTEEHLLPLMVVAGAAGADRGERVFRDKVMGAFVSAVRFG